jgi:hypothetical protein
LVAGSIPVSRSSLRPRARVTAGKPAKAVHHSAKREGGRLASQEGSQSRYEIGRLIGRSADGAKADVAQLAERVLGKDEVTSSILVIGSNLRSRGFAPASYGW